jgi:hypothetical protein
MIRPTRHHALFHREELTMSRRKHQRRLEEHYRNHLAPLLVGSAGVCVLLMLALYIATMPL